MEMNEKIEKLLKKYGASDEEIKNFMEDLANFVEDKIEEFDNDFEKEFEE